MNISHLIIRKVGKDDEQILLAESQFNIGTNEDCDVLIPGPGNTSFFSIFVFNNDLFIEREEKIIPIKINETNLIDKLILCDQDKIELFGIEITVEFNNNEIILFLNMKNSDYLTQPPEFINDDSNNYTEEIEAKIFSRNTSKLDNHEFNLNNKWKFVISAILMVLMFISYLIFSSYSIKFNIDPPDIDSLSIEGTWFEVPLGDRSLLRSGTHSLRIKKTGYYDLNQTFVVGEVDDLIVPVIMKKLPGIVSIYTNAGLNAQISLNGSLGAEGSFEAKAIEAGQYILNITSDRFLPFSDKIEIKGMNIKQHIFVDLIPRWANISIDSIPSDAVIYSKNIKIGNTPANLELMEGTHDLSVIKQGYQAFDGRFSVKANTSQTIKSINLEPANAELSIKTIPVGANIKVNGRYRGQSPLILSLMPDEDYVIAFSKSGFDVTERKIYLDPAQQQSIEVDLTARVGKVIISVNPPDADIYIDNKKRGKGKLEIELPTMSHDLLVKKEGYAPFIREILPRLDYLQNIDVKLLTEDEFRLRDIQSSLTNSQGQVLRRVEAGKFVMGASRREMGRRANEVIRNVELTKPFFIGINEVTNKEFSRFRRLNSAAADIHSSLLADNNPVVLVSWSDAVEYCNWLSNLEGLEPAYVKRFEKWERKKTVSNGYRLPSEAEWSWSIRYQTKNTTTAYPWGSRLPPRRNYANLADFSARNILPNILQNYDDGYASTSPVGSFGANSLGIFDGSGNVSEWISDYYSIPTPGITETIIDPKGPEYGVQHVIRGSSWRHSSVTKLRGSFRDFGSKGQIDIGFRLARNIN